MQHIYHVIMQISKFTDLSLRVLMYLSHDVEGEHPRINDIAERFQVPRNHLIKVVANMSKLGWVHTVRGRLGGLKLGVSPERLKLGDILASLEHGTLINCNKPACPIRGECNLKSILDLELNRFYKDLNKYSLSDILDLKTKQAVIRLHLVA